MDFADLLNVSRCTVDQRFASKAHCLSELARRAAPEIGVDAETIARALLHREDLGSTGVGGGIALPHARLASVQQPFCVLTRLREPLQFEAVDDKPVDIICLILLPSQQTGDQLNVLACAARRLRDATTAATVRQARDGKALYAAATDARAKTCA
jgi:nitrogen PTS system EIIA component